MELAAINSLTSLQPMPSITSVKTQILPLYQRVLTLYLFSTLWHESSSGTDTTQTPSSLFKATQPFPTQSTLQFGSSSLCFIGEYVISRQNPQKKKKEKKKKRKKKKRKKKKKKKKKLK
jgi:hypothetical protein